MFSCLLAQEYKRNELKLWPEFRHPWHLYSPFQTFLRFSTAMWQLTGDIHEEVESYTRMLDRMVQMCVRVCVCVFCSLIWYFSRKRIVNQQQEKKYKNVWFLVDSIVKPGKQHGCTIVFIIFFMSLMFFTLHMEKTLKDKAFFLFVLFPKWY